MREIDKQIDQHLYKLYEAENYSMFTSDLYGDVPIMDNGIARLDELMLDKGLISERNEVRTLTDIGEQIGATGGWLKYLKTQETRNQEEQERQRKEDEKLYYEARISKYLFKTRWLPHIIALISLILSLIALFAQFE